MTSDEDGAAPEVLSQDGAGDPDDLDRLWTPHRMAYIRGENKPDDATSGQCPFCRIPTLEDADGLVVRRGELAFAVLNLYPYAPGHLMVCPYRHIADYTETTDEEAAEIADLTRSAMRVVRAVSGAGGFNIGMNQGHIAGAGIAAHLHQHVVPRWPGDQNFMPIIGRTKTLPELLTETRTLLAEAWAAGLTRPGSAHERVRRRGLATLEGQDRRVDHEAVADLDGPPHRLVGVPRGRTLEHRAQERQQRRAVVPRRRAPQVRRAVVDRVVEDVVADLERSGRRSRWAGRTRNPSPRRTTRRRSGCPCGRRPGRRCAGTSTGPRCPGACS